MVSPPDPPPPQEASNNVEPACSGPAARVSFSADCLGEDTDDFISINLLSNKVEEGMTDPTARSLDFEFLSTDGGGCDPDMITADELFYEGKLLPFWQMHHSEKLKKISLKKKTGEEQGTGNKESLESNNIVGVGNWFVDDDPSPRPPNCTVLWKELLRLKKKQRASTLSPSSSSSTLKPAKKELAERTKSAATITRIRPMLNVPICKSQQGGRITSLPPLFPLRKSKTR